ncbi:MAG: hypothetical protein ABI408_01270 [Gemmatimonadaceae bacterium]
MMTNLLLLILGFLMSDSSRDLMSAPPALPGQVLDITADDFFFRSPVTARPGLATIRLRSPHNGHPV